MYGVYSLGGFALLSIMACVFVVGAFTLARRRSRSLGAGPTGVLAPLPPASLVAAPLGVVDPRADAHVASLHRLVWLLAAQARRPTNLVWLALPMLVVWGNLHGSVAARCDARDLLGAYELIRTRGRAGCANVGLLVLAPLALSSPPTARRRPRATTTCCSSIRRFAGQVTEWRLARPGS